MKKVLLFFEIKDSICIPHNNKIHQCTRFERVMLWRIYNNDKFLLYNQLFAEPSYLGYVFTPIIAKVALNKMDGLVYILTYWASILKINKCKPDGSTIWENPYPYGTQDYVDFYNSLSIKLNSQVGDYTYYGELFRYDFNTKEWTILEDRSLSEEEIAECGFYE